MWGIPRREKVGDVATNPPQESEHPMNRKLIGGLAVLAAGIAAAPAQAAPANCTYNPSSQIVSIDMPPAGGPVQLDWDQNAVAIFDGLGKHYCQDPFTGVAAVKENTQSILFIGTQAKDDFIISKQGGDYRGGAPGGTDPSQVEVNVISDSQDIVDVVGSQSGDFLLVMGGAGTGRQGGVSDFFNSKPLVKMTVDPSVVRINGLGGGDMIFGNGTFTPVTSMHLQLSGGDGNDSMGGGLLAGDRLQGDAGNDIFHTDDGQPGDNVTGGLGLDTATIDPSDQAFGVEKFLKPVGKLALTSSPLAADGTATAKLSWTHPKAWKKLRRVTLSAFDGDQRIGTVAMTPATGKITASGDLRLTEDATVTHKGKAVTAALRLAVAGATDRTLRLQVDATDTQGNRQSVPVAGVLMAG